MRTRLILSALCCLALSCAAHAQPDSLWSRAFGGEEDDYCYSLIQTANGGFALGGYTKSFGSGSADYWLVVTNEEGDSLWSHTYGGQQWDECYALIQTADGGFAMAGYTESFGSGGKDFWLLRTDESGDSLWSRTFGGDSTDICFSAIQTADSGFALAGYTESFGAGDRDSWIVRTDSTGDSLWSNTFGGGWDEWTQSLIQTEDSGFALAGYTWSFAANYTDGLLVRTDENGRQIWMRTYGGIDFDFCNQVIRTADGGFALAGYTWSYGAGEYNYWLVHADETGRNYGRDYWWRTYGGDSTEVPWAIAQTADEGFILAGQTKSFGSGLWDDWLVRTDANGDSLWSRTFGGDSSELCHSMCQTTDGAFVLAGSTRSIGEGGADFWLVKTGPDPVSVSEDFILHPSAFILSPPFPNPFNRSSVICYQLPVGMNRSLTIYDIRGRMVTTLANGYQSAGRHRLVWNAPDVAAGEYMIVLTSDGGKTEAQKVVLLK